MIVHPEIKMQIESCSALTASLDSVTLPAHRFLTVLFQKIDTEMKMGRISNGINISANEYARAHMVDNDDAFAMLMTDVDCLLDQILKCDNAIFKSDAKSEIRLFKVITAYIVYREKKFISVRPSAEILHLIGLQFFSDQKLLTKH